MSPAMNRSSVLSALCLALLFGPAAGSVQAQDAPPAPPGPRRQGPGFQGPGQPRPGARPGVNDRPMVNRAGRDRLAELGLSDAQKADMRKAMEGARRDKLRKSTDLKIARMDLKSLLQAEKVDEKAVAAKLLEAQAAQGALMKIRVDGALALKRILTPEQQKKMGQMRGERGPGRGGQRMKMRNGGGAGEGRGRGGRRFAPRPGGDDSDLDNDYDDEDDDGDEGRTDRR